MKLREPWRTDRLDERTSNVIVFALEEHRDGWHAVVERHDNCCGVGPHDRCEIVERIVGPASTTREGAYRALTHAHDMLRPWTQS